jgi:hypothetical protein
MLERMARLNCKGIFADKQELAQEFIDSMQHIPFVPSLAKMSILRSTIHSNDVIDILDRMNCFVIFFLVKFTADSWATSTTKQLLDHLTSA